MPNPITGGCQCGAVRYRITAPLENPHICHCRMCQKAFGNYFAALVGMKKTGLGVDEGPALLLPQLRDRAAWLLQGLRHDDLRRLL